MHYSLIIKGTLLACVALFGVAHAELFRNIDIAKELVGTLDLVRAEGFIALWQSQAAMVPLVWVAVAFIKSLVPTVQDEITIGVALAVGAILGLAGQLFGAFIGTPLEAIGFGLLAAVTAAGGRKFVLDALRDVVGRTFGQQTTSVPTQGPQSVTNEPEMKLMARQIGAAKDEPDFVERLLRELAPASVLGTLAAEAGTEVYKLAKKVIGGRTLTAQEHLEWLRELRKLEEPLSERVPPSVVQVGRGSNHE